LNLEAIISYCHIVGRDRGPSSVYGQCCGAFLNALTEESVILLGMIADAIYECMMATRVMDHEILDTGNMWSELAAFRHRFEHLFMRGKALSTGYTNTALENLHAPRATEVPGACLRSLGCKSRRWGKPVPHAHWPAWQIAPRWRMRSARQSVCEYDVLANFPEFFVTDTGNSSSANAPSHAANMSYIANVFKVDPTKLIHQTEQHKPIAVREK
jgi:hypothetical protein